MDVSGAAAYVLSPSFVLFGSLGRTISANDVNASSLVFSTPSWKRHRICHRRAEGGSTSRYGLE
jgi:hypothetical protein